MSGSDVIGALTLPLDTGVLQPGVGARYDFGDCIGPIGPGWRKRHIALDHGCPGAALHDDQVSRVRHAASSVASRDEDQMHRTRDIGIRRYVDESTISDER